MTIRTRLLISLATWCCAVPASAQTHEVTWDCAAGAADSYEVCLAATCTNVGTPTVSTGKCRSTFSTSVGTRVEIKAVKGSDKSVCASIAAPAPLPMPPPPGTLTLTVVSPADGATFPNSQTSTVGFQAVVQGSADTVSITGVFGLSPTRVTCAATQTATSGSDKCVAAGGTWTFTFHTGAGPGTRDMWFEGKNSSGTVVKTPVQKVIIQ